MLRPAPARLWWTPSIIDSYFDGKPLMGSPLPIILVIVFYLTFTKKLGPYLMKNRTPFDLNKVLIIYNFVQVGVSCVLTWMGATVLIQYGLFDPTCSATKSSLYLIGAYAYFLAKVSELLDTVFFVLRKKQNQVTFLHVYHHTIMVLVVWLCLKYEPTHCGSVMGTLNSFVHVVMYSYYGLSAIPAMRPYLWWKKHLTKMQLIQFALVFLHSISFSMVSKCPPSYVLLGVMVFNALFFTFLFSKFYIDSYFGTDAKEMELESLLCFNVNENDECHKTESNIISNGKGAVHSKKNK